MVQFLYAVFGGGMGYICYSTLPAPINILLAFLIGAFTVCVIFVKINERPFLGFMANMLTYILKPKVRVWSKSNQPFKVDVYQSPSNSKNKTINQKKVTKEDISRLAETIDQHGSGAGLIKV